jgi:hypothetical protein
MGILFDLHLKMAAHLLFHLALVSASAQPKKQSAPGLRKKPQKNFQ